VSKQSPTHGEAPLEIADLVRQRVEARVRHDWRAADDLKARIEAAGWRVTDHGRRSSVGPAAPSTVEVGDEIRYGSAAAIPSRLDDPATAAWTLVVVASEDPGPFSRLMTALRAYAPAGTQVIVVINDASTAQEAALLPGSPDRAPIGGSDPELVRTSVRLGYAAALNIGLRRAAGKLVLLADTTAVPTGDALTPLAAVLNDPAVAAAGGCGLVADDPAEPRPNLLHRLEDINSPTEALALELGWLAFRRSDCVAVGPFDEHFVTPAWLDVGWSLRLRFGAPAAAEAPTAGADEAADETTTAGPAADAPAEFAPDRTAQGPTSPPARRALAVPLPLVRDAAPWPPERTRLNRRNMYRVIGEFGAVTYPD
jgi:hypothetical protein